MEEKKRLRWIPLRKTHRGIRNEKATVGQERLGDTGMGERG